MRYIALVDRLLEGVRLGGVVVLLVVLRSLVRAACASVLRGHDTLLMSLLVTVVWLSLPAHEVSRHPFSDGFGVVRANTADFIVGNAVGNEGR